MPVLGYEDDGATPILGTAEEYYNLNYNKMIAPMYRAFYEHVEKQIVWKDEVEEWKSEKDKQIEELQDRVKYLEDELGMRYEHNS